MVNSTYRLGLNVHGSSVQYFDLNLEFLDALKRSVSITFLPQLGIVA